MARRPATAVALVPPDPTPTIYERDEHDRFFTKPELARAIAWAVVGQVWRSESPEVDSYTLLEPSCGSGNLITALHATGLKLKSVTGVDVVLAPELAKVPCPIKFVQGDWLQVAPRYRSKADIIISNPPFARLEPAKKKGSKGRRVAIIQSHVEAMHVALKEGGVCAVLAAQRFLGHPRSKWLKNLARPFKVLQLTPRPSFTLDGGTDMSEYVVAFWRKVDGSVNADRTDFDWLEWEETGTPTE